MENEMPNLEAVEQLEGVEEVVGREPDPGELNEMINYLEDELWIRTLRKSVGKEPNPNEIMDIIDHRKWKTCRTTSNTNGQEQEMRHLHLEDQENHAEEVVVGRVSNMDKMVEIIEYIERLDGNPCPPQPQASQPETNYHLRINIIFHQVGDE